MNLLNSDDQFSDQQLLAKVTEGDSTAFDMLYARHWRQVYNNAYKRLKDEDLSKDVVQEIFVAIWLRRENPILNLPAYLNIAVRNQVFKILEKQKNVTPFLDIMQDIPSTYNQIDGNLLWKEFYKSYELLLTTLPPKRQVIFRLRFQDDMSTMEIANQLGVSRKTVQNQLGKAVEQLRSSLLQLLSLLIILLIK